METKHRDPLHALREPVLPWERRRRLKPPRAWVLPLAGAVLALGALYQAGDHWLAWRAQQRPVPSSQEPALPLPGVLPLGPATPASSAVGPPSAPAARTQQFSKCIGRAGQATYSDGPCPPGTQASTVSVQPDLNLAEGLSPEARRASRQDNRALARAQAPAQEGRTVARQGESVVDECQRWEARIAWLDGMARRPQSGDTQDGLRHERKQARDRQFALHCP